jgi:hypothetical protein
MISIAQLPSWSDESSTRVDPASVIDERVTSPVFPAQATDLRSYERGAGGMAAWRERMTMAVGGVDHRGTRETGREGEHVRLRRRRERVDRPSDQLAHGRECPRARTG